MKQYDIKPPENPLEQMLHKSRNERGNVLEQKLAKKGEINSSNKLDNINHPAIQSNEHQSLENILGIDENNKNISNNKKKKHKRKKRSLLPFRNNSHKPIKKLSKKARHTAMFLGLFAFPITFLVLGIGMFLFIGAALNYAHQVEVISTLASPKYYAELGARGILGGARKITDIPQDLIGQQPDLNVDYSHNGAMNKHDKLSNSIGSVGGKNGLAIRKSIARAVAKYLGSSHPEFVFAQMWAEHGGYEITGEAAHDHNLSGIKYFGQKGATKGESAPGGGDDGNYARFKSWKDYSLTYAKLLKKKYPGVAKATTAAEYAHALKHGTIGAYYQAPESQYAANMSAGVKIYKSNSNSGSAITDYGDTNTVMYGNGTKKVDPSDVTTKTGSLNDSNPHRTKRLLYFYSKRFAGSGNNNSSSTEVIKGGGLTKLMKIVHSLLGIPYVFGGAHGDLHSYKKGMDCSGLINVIWWKAGLGEHHLNTVGWEDQCSQYVSKSELQPGDLLFWGDKHSSHHVALYLGHNKYVQEPEPGQNCEIRPLSWNPYSFAKRNTAMHNYIKKHATIIKKKSGKKSSNNEAPTGSGSVYKQFIKAGGTPEMWKWIVMPESSGNPNAVNGQYHGLGQTNQSWGYGSVAKQTRGMVKYAKERYGGIKQAISFRRANNWW